MSAAKPLNNRPPKTWQVAQRSLDSARCLLWGLKTTNTLNRLSKKNSAGQMRHSRVSIGETTSWKGGGMLRTIVSIADREILSPVFRRLGTGFTAYLVGMGVATDQATTLAAGAVVALGLGVDLVLSHLNRRD